MPARRRRQTLGPAGQTAGGPQQLTLGNDRVPGGTHLGQLGEPGRRLDQAYGRSGEPLIPVEAPETPRVERVFAEPIGLPVAISRMNIGMSIDVGHASMHGAS